MTKLEEIKNQVAKEVSGYSAKTAREFIELEFSYVDQENMINIVAERYAVEMKGETVVFYRKQTGMLLNAVDTIQIQIARLESADDSRLKPVIEDLKKILTGPINPEKLYTEDQVRASCKATLEKAAENARTSGTHPVTIDKSSITNPDNICIL